MTTDASVEEQMAVLMRGVEYGDPNLHAAMEEDLRAKLALGKPLRVYCGFDPTAVDLHLGHLIPMLKLRQFQQFGHEVTFLIGTMTGIVGDPSDKTAARQMLTTEVVETNAQTWLRQAYRVLDEEKTVVRRNGDWLAPLTFAEVVELAATFTVSQFLDHETYRRRLAESKPLYLHEFIYALMQAYDAFHMETDVQVGGVEQLFNIMAGRQLQRARGQRPLTAVCLPILTGTDGHLRMSKSTGNYISLDDPPADMYGKVMSIPDALMPNYYTLLAGASAEAVSALEAGLERRSLNPMEAKKRLARAVVALLYDEAAATEAEAEFEVTHQTRTPASTPEETVVDLIPLPAGTVDVHVQAQWEPTAKAPGEKEAQHQPLPQLLHEYGLAPSVSEARRLMRQGAIEAIGSSFQQQDGMFIRTSPRGLTHSVVTLEDGMIIRVGRHRFCRIVAAVES